MSGCNVYVIGPPVGPQKIGLARDVADRLKHLQVAQPVEIQIHAAHPMLKMDAYSVERIAHAFLAPWRQKGEWFDVAPATAKAAVERACRDVQRGHLPPSPKDVANGLFWMRRLGGYSAERLDAARAYAELVEFVTLGAESYSAATGEERSHRMVTDARVRLSRLDNDLGGLAVEVLRKVACCGDLPSGREVPILNKALDLVFEELASAK